MSPKLNSIFFSVVFVAFLATPTTVLVLNLDIDTSICYQISEEEHEIISKIDFKEVLLHNSNFCLVKFDVYGATFHDAKASNIKNLAKETTSPPPENLV